MNGQELLNAYLAQWAKAESVTLNWVRGTLRLEDADGTAGAVVSFPPDFWEQFQEAGQDQRERALDAIRHCIWSEYRPAFTPYAHVIDVPSNYLWEYS